MQNRVRNKLPYVVLLMLSILCAGSRLASAQSICSRLAPSEYPKRVSEIVANGLGSTLSAEYDNVRELIRLGANAVPYVLDEARNKADYGMLLFALGEFGPDARLASEFVLAKLEDDDPFPKLLAAEVLIKLHIDEELALTAIEPFLANSEHSQYAVRTLARADANLTRLPILLARVLGKTEWGFGQYDALKIAIDRGVFFDPDLQAAFHLAEESWGESLTALYLQDIGHQFSDSPGELALKSKSHPEREKAYRFLLIRERYFVLINYLDYLTDEQACEVHDAVLTADQTEIVSLIDALRKIRLPVRTRLFIDSLEIESNTLPPK